jgi:branched-chain amino acid transport system substrate-binding protein
MKALNHSGAMTERRGGGRERGRGGFTIILAFAFLLSVPTAWAQYRDKPDTNAYTVEPLLPAGAPAVQKQEEGEYPYYGNCPADLLPYRNIEPYYKYWLTRLPFRGPGRDYPDPQNLKSLKVGLLSPPPYGPEAQRGEMGRKGVKLAFDEANEARKPGELPFELVEKADSPQWGSAANIAVEFADNEVLGFIGTIDGDATHVALRVALKIETFMVNCSDPDPTLTETQIPWLIRVFPDNRQQGYLLAEYMVKQKGLKKIVVMRSNSRPGRAGVRPFVDSVRRLGHPILQEINFLDGSQEMTTQVAVLKKAEPDAVVFWGNPADAGRAAAALRAAGVQAAFFGFDRVVEPEFAKVAGPAAEGTVAAYFFDPDKKDAPWQEFSRKFQNKYGLKPEAYAGYSYDGARLLIDAIKKAGPNRYRVQNILSNLDQYEGVTGHMQFDGRWDNIAPVALGEYRQGQWHFQPAAPVKQAALTPKQPDAN